MGWALDGATAAPASRANYPRAPTPFPHSRATRERWMRPARRAWRNCPKQGGGNMRVGIIGGGVIARLILEHIAGGALGAPVRYGT